MPGENHICPSLNEMFSRYLQYLIMAGEDWDMEDCTDTAWDDEWSAPTNNLEFDDSSYGYECVQQETLSRNVVEGTAR
jgi:hypothetical protein